ncbi:MAG: MaoC family dehydratase [Armatimonadota bacterium]|nr:MaoC family dehydratase [Armatimonadota bacterium]MDW8155922.1 MaoC family dehydratase [Armatimonadota bacterium]
MSALPFHPGQRAEIRRTVTEADLVAFAGLSGDLNPLHTDAVYAARTRFRQRIAHGALLAGWISAVLGTRLPGPGGILMSFRLRFLRPTCVGDTVTAWAEVAAVRADKPVVTLRVGCDNQRGETVVEGEAVCYWEPVQEG